MERHNTSLCGGCFNLYVHDQVDRAITEQKMFDHGEQILVAISGGKTRSPSGMS